MRAILEMEMPNNCQQCLLYSSKHSTNECMATGEDLFKRNQEGFYFDISQKQR